jgi:hypothetical protein
MKPLPSILVLVGALATIGCDHNPLELRDTTPVPTSPTPPAIPATPKPTPKPGAWMWESKTGLDMSNKLNGTPGSSHQQPRR